MTTPQTERELLDAAIAAHAETLKWSPQSFAGADAIRAFESASGKYVHHLIASQTLTRPAAPDADDLSKQLGFALVRVLQEDYEPIKKMARTVKIVFPGGEPVVSLTPSATAPDAVRGLVEAANPAIEAIQFALSADDGIEFLRKWNEGDFDACRKWWPEAPAAVYVGADPLFPLAAPAVDGGECSLRSRCDCIGACKHGRGGNGATPPADAERPAQVEAFGWVREWDGDVSDLGNFHFTQDKGETNDGLEWTAVYTTPPPAVDVDQIEDVLHGTYMVHDDYKVTSTLLRDMAEAVAKHLAHPATCGQGVRE